MAEGTPLMPPFGPLREWPSSARLLVGAALFVLALPLDACAAQRQLHDLLDLPRQTLSFQPTRDDFTVGRVVFSLYAAKPDEVRINGVSLDPAWVDVHLANGEVVVDERLDETRTYGWIYVDLPRVGTNRFELGPLRIEAPSNGGAGLVCMSLKAWFHEVPNETDGLYYQDLADRYALVSYCNRQTDHPPEVQARFGRNQVATPSDFAAALARPFVIELNQRPLREE